MGRGRRGPGKKAYIEAVIIPLIVSMWYNDGKKEWGKGERQEDWGHKSLSLTVHFADISVCLACAWGPTLYIVGFLVPALYLLVTSRNLTSHPYDN